MRSRCRNQQTHFSTFVAVLVASMTLLAGSIASLGAQVQTRQQPRQYQPPPQGYNDPLVATVIVSPTEEYRIGPSDVIEIIVEDAPELSRGAIRVGADGTILMPFLGTLKAQNLTTQELAAAISDGLRGRYLNDPQVTVAVMQINSRTYFIQGAVRRPGVYQVEGRPTLWMLITVAGGLADNYGSTAFIMHQIKNAPKASSGGPNAAPAAVPVSQTVSQASSEPEAGYKPAYDLTKVNINGLLRGNLDQNVTLEPGDIIHIPVTDVFFVAGEVNAPGSFPLKEGTTLRQAISLAQGTSFAAAPNRCVIFREDPNTGKREEIKVDVAAVMSGKQQDIPIISNDIVIVPNSRLKSVGSTLLRAFGVNSARLPVRYGY